LDADCGALSGAGEALAPTGKIVEIAVIFWRHSGKSPLAKAIRYTLGHWAGLCVFLSDGRVEADNNIVERSIRPIALGRKNSLFAGSDGGAESWAILASLINTAKLHNLDPQTYLTGVLERMVSGTTKANALSALLPWNWKAAQVQPAIAA
jgi:hypothetical protein